MLSAWFVQELNFRQVEWQHNIISQLDIDLFTTFPEKKMFSPHGLYLTCGHCSLFALYSSALVEITYFPRIGYVWICLNQHWICCTCHKLSSHPLPGHAPGPSSFFERHQASQGTHIARYVAWNWLPGYQDGFDCLPWKRKTIGVSFWWILFQIPIYLIDFLEYLFFWSQVMPE